MDKKLIYILNYEKKNFNFCGNLLVEKYGHYKYVTNQLNIKVTKPMATE